jgi:hypothetical protein
LVFHQPLRQTEGLLRSLAAVLAQLAQLGVGFGIF